MPIDVVKNIADTCSKLGDVELAGIKLENAGASLLDVSFATLDRHVAMQPAAVAYYGALKKDAARRLAALGKAYDHWQKKKYAESKVAVETGTANKSSIKVEDVKARFIVDNETEIIKWEAQIEKVQFEYDTLDVWFEAWKQKSFSIREMAGIDEEERFNTSSSITRKGDQTGAGQSGSKAGIERVRELIRRRREQAKP